MRLEPRAPPNRHSRSHVAAVVATAGAAVSMALSSIGNRRGAWRSQGRIRPSRRPRFGTLRPCPHGCREISNPARSDGRDRYCRPLVIPFPSPEAWSSPSPEPEPPRLPASKGGDNQPPRTRLSTRVDRFRGRPDLRPNPLVAGRTHLLSGRLHGLAGIGRSRSCHLGLPHGIPRVRWHRPTASGCSDGPGRAVPNLVRQRERWTWPGSADVATGRTVAARPRPRPQELPDRRRDGAWDSPGSSLCARIACDPDDRPIACTRVRREARMRSSRCSRSHPPFATGPRCFRARFTFSRNPRSRPLESACNRRSTQRAKVKPLDDHRPIETAETMTGCRSRSTLERALLPLRFEPAKARRADGRGDERDGFNGVSARRHPSNARGPSLPAGTRWGSGTRSFADRCGRSRSADRPRWPPRGRLVVALANDRRLARKVCYLGNPTMARTGRPAPDGCWRGARDFGIHALEPSAFSASRWGSRQARISFLARTPVDRRRGRARQDGRGRKGR